MPGDGALIVYGDIIILENLVINYIILCVTARFLKSSTSSLRLFIGALIGAGYVILLLLLPSIKAYYTGAAKFILSLFIVAISFYPHKIKDFIKILGVFYLTTFLFAGAAFAFFYFNHSGGFVRNGIICFFGNSNWIILFLAIITVGIIVRVIKDLWAARLIKDNLLIPVNVNFENKSVSFEALVDTGNSLCDPLSKLPVVVVEFNAICSILPEDIRCIFEEKRENDLTIVTTIVAKSSWFSRFRIIPFSSLGRENGILLGFKPDFILIGEAETQKNVCEVVIGIYNRQLSKNEKYKALLGPELVT